MNFEHCYIKNMLLAQSINELRTEMRSNQKCVAIYLNKRIPICIGVNKCKTHPILLKFKYDMYKYFSIENFSRTNKKNNVYPIHAELDGYIKLLNSENDFDTLFIYRGNNCDLPSEPCHVCSKWLTRIDKLTICYVNTNGNYEQVNSSDLIGHYRTKNVRYIPYHHCCE